jgi:hypothetical protein
LFNVSKFIFFKAREFSTRNRGSEVCRSSRLRFSKFVDRTNSATRGKTRFEMVSQGLIVITVSPRLK